MARITGSTIANWSNVSLGQLDFAAHFRTFAVRLHQILADYYNGNFTVVSSSSTQLVLDTASGRRLTLSGSGVDSSTPTFKTITSLNPSNGSGEIVRASGTVNGGAEVLTSASIGSPGFSETLSGNILIPSNFLISGTYAGTMTSLAARIGSATVTFRGTFSLSGNLTTASMAGTVTSIAVAAGGSTISMTGLSISWDGVEAALASNSLASVEDLFVFVGNHLPGNDTISYTNHSGTGLMFVGGAGNDTITIGGSNDDTLVGGAGDDVLRGGLGQDTIIGDADDDQITMLVSAGNEDSINAGTGVDTLILSGVVSGNQEVVVDLSQADQVVSIGGTLDGLSQANLENLTAAGLGGVVTVTGSAEDNVLIGSRGNDIISGAAGDDTLAGGLGNDQLDGGDDHDQLDGGVGQDTVLGGSGDDRITMLVTAGNVDVIDAGADADTLVLSGRVPGNRQVVVDLSSVTDQVVSIGGVTEGLAQTGFEQLDASGIGGSVLVTGSADDNLIIGSRGNDTLIGGDGDDTYVIGQGTDVLTEHINEGTDLVQSSITHTLGVNFENLTMTGVKAINGIGNDLANVLTGNNAANILIGGDGNDTLIGNGGNDRLDGGLDDDAMDGGAGNDTYIVDSLGDTVTESVAGAAGGTDLVQSAVDFQLGTNLERLTLTGTDHIDGTGNELANILIGNSGNNVLNGGGGADRMVGGAGDDSYIVDSLGDTVIETLAGVAGGMDLVQSAVTYTLGANVENLTLTGTGNSNGTGNALDNVLIGNNGDNVLAGLAGHDHLNGGDGADLLLGGLGDDELEGNDGNDTVNGGLGNDTYEFSLGHGQDLVQDNGGTADRLSFHSGIDPLEVVLSRQANDLRIAIQGTSDHVTIQNWYTSSANRIETIEAGNGQVLLSTQVEQLIQAMAAFTTQTGLTWEQAAAGLGDPAQQAQFQGILAGNWQ